MFGALCITNTILVNCCLHMTLHVKHITDTHLCHEMFSLIGSIHLIIALYGKFSVRTR